MLPWTVEWLGQSIVATINLGVCLWTVRQLALCIFTLVDLWDYFNS